nr:hypothetical protein [Methanobrevibacter smithii]
MKKIANIFFVSFIVMIMILTTLFSYGGQIAFAEDNGDTNTAAEIIEVNTESKEDDLGDEIIPFEHDETETDDTEETDITEGEESNIIEYEAEPEIENNTENTDNGEEINEAHTDSIVVDTEWGLEMYEVGSIVKFIVSADETIISNDSVKWSVENHLDENTRITDDGILYISAAESSEEIKVTATSKLYENIKSSFNIKIVKSIDELMNLATTTELATEDIVGGVFTDIGTQEYLTGSNIIVYSGVTINNEQGILEGGYARVTVPKKYINGNLMVSTGATLLENPIVTKDSDNFYIQYKYIKLTGGTSSKIPFTFTTKNFTTPNNSTINIKQELFDKDGNIIDTKELEIINKASGKYYTHNDSFTFNVVKPDGETSLPADPDSNNSYVSHTRSIGSSTGLLADYNKLGVYNTQKAKIVLKLKDGIVFDPSYDPVNNDWTYDAANRTLTKIINTPVNNSWMTDKVSLKYPGFPINCGKWEDAYTSQIIGLDENGQELPDTASGVAQHKVRFCPVVLRITKTPASNNYIRNTPESGTYEWTVEAYSDKTDNITFYLSKIEDTDLNDHLYYTSVKIDTSKLNASEKEKAKTNILYGVKKDGTVEVVANNIPIDEYYDLDENNHLSPTDVYRQIYVEFPDRLTINGGEGVKLLLKTKVFEKDWEEGIKDNPSYFLNGTKGVFCNASNTNNILYNYARASYSSSNNGPLTYTNKTNNWIRIYTGGQAYIAAAPDKSSLLINNEVTVSSRVTATLPMDNGKIFVLVPNGYTILENRTRISYTAANYTRITKSFTPEVIYDWNGTGKTGLIFDLTKINNLYNEMDGKARDFQAFVTLKTTSSTPEGISLVDYYSSWDNNTINGTYPVKNGNNTPVEDQYDLNKNGNTNDLVLYAKSELTFIPPREVIGIKTVGKTLDSMLVGKTGNMNAGDVVYYGIDIKNLQKENTVRKLSVLDILPYNGDKNIVKNA